MTTSANRTHYIFIPVLFLSVIVFGAGCHGPSHAQRIRGTYTILTETGKSEALIEIWKDLSQLAPPGDQQIKHMAEDASKLTAKRIDLYAQTVRYMYEDNSSTMKHFLRENEDNLQQLQAMNESFKRQLLEKIYPHSSSDAGM